jgi:hypothetical protein
MAADAHSVASDFVIDELHSEGRPHGALRKRHEMLDLKCWKADARPGFKRHLLEPLGSDQNGGFTGYPILKEKVGVNAGDNSGDRNEDLGMVMVMMIAMVRVMAVAVAVAVAMVMDMITLRFLVALAPSNWSECNHPQPLTFLLSFQIL